MTIQPGNIHNLSSARTNFQAQQVLDVAHNVEDELLRLQPQDGVQMDSSGYVRLDDAKFKSFGNYGVASGEALLDKASGEVKMFNLEAGGKTLSMEENRGFLGLGQDRKVYTMSPEADEKDMVCLFADKSLNYKHVNLAMDLGAS